MPHSPELTESPKMTPPSPQSQGLGSAGKFPYGDDSAQIPPEDPPQWPPCIADTLSKVSDFVKARFHIRRFITTAVNTEEERTITEALKGNLETAS
jgi:hypothetical protein